MAGTLKNLFGPVALTTTYTTNIYNGAGGSALIYDIMRHMHVVNKLATDTFRLYVGATGANAAGTELFFNKSVAANDTYDWYCARRLISTDFLVGGAATTLTLVIYGSGEQYVI